MAKILVVDDEQNLVDSLQYSLRAEGYEVAIAKDGEEALAKARDLLPDLIILDLMIPIISGKDVCRIIRKESNVPILMLTAKDNEIDRIVGLEIGADDYITKPFSMRELVVRVRNSLRRRSFTASENTSSVSKEIIKSGDLEIDLTSHVIRLNGENLEMKPREFDLLVMLASSKGRAFTRDQILERLWDHEYIGDIRTVDVHVRWIREKIEVDPGKPSRIVTIRGVGYRFDG